MAIRDIDVIKVWDGKCILEKNIDLLCTPTKPVTFPISNQIKQIIQDLIDTYKAIPCAGIAANQIGYENKLFIGMKYDEKKSVSSELEQNIDQIEPDPNNYELYINPQIDKADKKSTQIGDEGCLSIPNITLQIERFNKIKVRYYNFEGRSIKKPLEGFLSRLFQHELDHLNGNLMCENPFSINNDSDHKYIKLIDKLIEYTLKKNIKNKQ